jgi:N-acetylmuramoyl-L-alanine amidase
VKQAPFVVLMGVNMPAVLLEIGFLTHPEEGKKLGHADHQDAIAAAVVKALIEVRARRDRAAEPAAQQEESEQ